jgi:uncharacterized membrane protein
MKESTKRSIAKTIIWRVIGTFITWGIVYLYTGELSKSTNISLIVAVFLAVGYYINERVWNSIEWGRANNHRRHSK